MKKIIFLFVLTPSFVLADKAFSEEEIKLCNFLNKHAIIPSEDWKVGSNKFIPDMISKVKELKLLPSDDYIIFPPYFVLLEYLEMLDISDNKFYLLPPEIEKLKNLQVLIIENTSFCHIVLKGLEDVMTEVSEILSSKGSNLSSSMRIYSKDKGFEFLVKIYMPELKEKEISLGSCLESLFLYVQDLYAQEKNIDI